MTEFLFTPCNLLFQGSISNNIGVYNTTTSTSSNECPYPEFVGDNYCDDPNNNEECDWDGGDCCGNNVNSNFCSVCECLDPNFD